MCVLREFRPQAAFDREQFEAAIKHRGMYEAAYNFFAACHTSSPQKGVPFNVAKVRWLQDKFFKTARLDLPSTVIVALRTDESPEDSFGSLMLLSPPEICHAFLLSVADQVRCIVSDDDLRRWRACALTTTFRFEVIDNSMKRCWRSLQIREDSGLYGDAVKRTAIQRGYDVMEIKSMLEETGTIAMGAEALAAAWRQNVSLGATSEPIRSPSSTRCSRCGHASWRTRHARSSCSSPTC